MTSPPLITGMRRGMLLASMLVAVFPHCALSQIASLKKAAASLEVTKPIADEKPDEARKRLQLWDSDARDTLARLEAPGAAAALPEGVSPTELDERRRDLEHKVLLTTRLLKNFGTIDDARKALEASRAEAAAWTGFKTQPPYSLLLIDDLLNERDAIKSNLVTYEASVANYERILASIMGEAKTAEEGVNSALGALQKADAAAREAAKWRLEAAHDKSRVLAARAGLMQSLLGSLKDRIGAASTDVGLLERQIKTAKANSRFNDEDLAKLGKASEERKQAIRKELEGVAKRLKTALAARTQAQAAVNALPAPAPPAAESPAELAKFRLEVAEGRVDAMQALTEGLESLQQLENIGLKAYQDRLALVQANSSQQRARALDALGVPRESLWAWINVIDDDLTRTNAECSKLEARAAALGSEDPRFSLLSEQRTYSADKLALLQRLSQAVEAQRKLVKRWILESTPEAGQAGWSQRLATLGATSWGAVKKLWSFEVMSFEDKIEVDGQTITGKIPVTLGMLLRAVLFFFIGYWIASLIARRIHRSLVSRGRIADAQGRTLRNWGMILVGIFLVIGTLAFLRIPLTVFAFFGGALAIGLGFGTQTLIKNFISGIIVLVERKVRVGDIVEVDGISGTVTEINTRSSVLRGPDDVETMIPNSVLLDSRVTNRTLSHSRMRRSLNVGVASGTPPGPVMAFLTEAAGRHGLVCKEPAPFAVFEDFGENALLFSLYFWLDLGGPANAMIVTSDLRLMIAKNLSEAGLGVPFPQRDVHLATAKPLQVQWVGNTTGQAGP